MVDGLPLNLFWVNRPPLVKLIALRNTEKVYKFIMQQSFSIEILSVHYFYDLSSTTQKIRRALASHEFLTASLLYIPPNHDMVSIWSANSTQSTNGLIWFGEPKQPCQSLLKNLAFFSLLSYGRWKTIENSVYKFRISFGLKSPEPNCYHKQLSKD